jgi:glycerol-3-phosphate cytidylyltransferase
MKPLPVCLGLSKMRVGFTASAFDLLHAGHVQMLREAKEQCDYLICGLQLDPSLDRRDKNSPVQSIVERYTQLKGVKYVDEIIPYATERDLEDILNLYRIDVRILGEEYREKEFTGRDICKKRGIDLYFNKRDHRFSSSDLRKRVVESEIGNDAANKNNK